jgi:hypothetical protein
MGLPTGDPQELSRLSLAGKKCEFCGKDAVSGVGYGETSARWCFDCGLEFSRIMVELELARPHLQQLDWKHQSFLSLWKQHPELVSMSNEVTQEALRIMRERKRKPPSTIN